MSLSCGSETDTHSPVKYVTFPPSFLREEITLGSNGNGYLDINSAKIFRVV